jgi:hypothetical protein
MAEEVVAKRHLIGGQARALSRQGSSFSGFELKVKESIFTKGQQEV